MTMHTEMITINKRLWNEMKKELHDCQHEIDRLNNKIQSMKEAIALIIDEHLKP